MCFLEDREISRQKLPVPSNNKKLSLIGCWSYSSPEIHGEDRARAVEYGGQ